MNARACTCEKLLVILQAGCGVSPNYILVISYHTNTYNIQSILSSDFEIYKIEIIK